MLHRFPQHEVVLLPKQYHKNRLRQLTDGCYPVACEAFHVQGSAEFFADVEGHILDCSGIVLSREENHTVGFCAWKYVPYGAYGFDTIVYISGVCVLPQFQNCGVAKEMIMKIFIADLRRSLPDKHAFLPLPSVSWFVMRTQSPKMKRAFDAAIGHNSFPNGAPLPEDARFIASHTMKYLKQTMDEDTLICRGAYGHSLYGETEPLDRCDYAAPFSRLDTGAGDAQVCVWRA